MNNKLKTEKKIFEKMVFIYWKNKNKIILPLKIAEN